MTEGFIFYRSLVIVVPLRLGRRNTNSCNRKSWKYCKADVSSVSPLSERMRKRQRSKHHIYNLLTVVVSPLWTRGSEHVGETVFDWENWLNRLLVEICQNKKGGYPFTFKKRLEPQNFDDKFDRSKWPMGRIGRDKFFNCCYWHMCIS